MVFDFFRLDLEYEIITTQIPPMFHFSTFWIEKLEAYYEQLGFSVKNKWKSRQRLWSQQSSIATPVTFPTIS